jgi:hypothetical protein
MDRKLLQTVLCMLLLVLLSSLPLSATTPVRGSSDNGTNPDAATWNLFGRSRTISLSGNGKRVAMRRQTVCLNEDVEDSLPNPNLLLTGTCDSGAYLHIFQFESSATDVTVTVRHFFADANSPLNYGVLICDNNNPQTGNTLELCTFDPAGIGFPPIKISIGKTAVRFKVGAFPRYRAGIDNQGRGLTLYVIAPQASPLPIQLPTVEIH